MEVCVDDLLHGVVANELVGGELGPGDRVEVAHAVQVFLDVLAVVGDAYERDARPSELRLADLGLFAGASNCQIPSN